MIEKYSYYEFEVNKIIVMVDDKACMKYIYKIYHPDYKPCDASIIRESDEWFDTEQEARFAAIGHIDLLENGEG